MPTDLDVAARAVAVAERILVLGSSGSGKSRFSKRLCAIMNREPVHLDALFWQPGWTPSEQGVWRRQVTSLVEKSNWIMEGTYESTLDVRLPRAQAVIYLDSSRYRCLWRASWRAVRKRASRPPESPLGQRIDFGLVGYIWRFPKVTRPLILRLIREFGKKSALVELRGPKEAGLFLSSLEREYGTSEDESP